MHGILNVMLRVNKAIYILFCLCAFATAPLFSFAQIPSTSSSLLVSPLFPEANEIYTVKLDGYTQNRASLSWFVNGIEQEAYRNKNSLTTQAGNIGAVQNITAKIRLQSGGVVDVKHTVTAQRVDLLIEADTVVPLFYKGRSLPSSGSSVRATALVFTKMQQGAGSFAYLWKLNGQTQNGGAVQGDNTFTFTPSFESQTELEVSVLNKNGTIIAQESQLIPITKPELVFYEKNPLKGQLFTALTDPYLFIGDEITIRAEGYFMSRNLLGSDALHEWKVNSKTTQSNSAEPTELTLQKEGGRAAAKISFHVRNLKQLLQGVEKTITINF
jgi:hypothetical protein